MHEKLKQIELLLLDVDGVMTDGRIIWDAHGVETKAFNVKDGHGIKLVQRAGVQVGIITGRTSPVVDLRARELGIDILYQGALKKLDSYLDIKRRTGLEDHQIAYMGDDVIDVPVMRRVGFSAAPADALPEVAALADYVARCGGGCGAVRELCDLVLKARGQWQELVASRYEL
ncbi:MAG: HAD hydrolase family protein [Geobacter sp.]|jgi:3-deoxy-D-manno-octulosonate 8-phosphate phosphatase (KDO 8-P phosphatase)|uniref:KdsC family phosphatase n=1 Tax=Trichlorobacter sp. TaxID=2911007 RepID=UPI002A36AADF|nr:HAD hydrolase family protein [Trichlorobacter sp.]MDY0385132.1 HAD hydrolase family protein [Trichlorobacter sp.]